MKLSLRLACSLLLRSSDVRSTDPQTNCGQTSVDTVVPPDTDVGSEAVSQAAGLPVRASIGVAALSPDEVGASDSAEDLLRRADEALYTAKRSGRDRVEVAHVHH